MLDSSLVPWKLYIFLTIFNQMRSHRGRRTRAYIREKSFPSIFDLPRSHRGIGKIAYEEKKLHI